MKMPIASPGLVSVVRGSLKSRRFLIFAAGFFVVVLFMISNRSNGFHGESKQAVIGNADVGDSAERIKGDLLKQENDPSSPVLRKDTLLKGKLGTNEVANGYSICDNPITRTIQRDTLIKGLDERFKFSKVALPRLTELLNAHMTQKWEPQCGFDACRFSRGWSGLTNWHERFDMMGNIAVKCPDLRSFGSGDDEKRFCWSDELVSGKECVVFSIGSANHWGFEEAMVAKTNCVVHTFDCTVDGLVPEAIKSRVTFHKYCIGSPTIGPLFKTLDELVQVAGVPHVSFLKMDIEVRN